MQPVTEPPRTSGCFSSYSRTVENSKRSTIGKDDVTTLNPMGSVEMEYADTGKLSMKLLKSNVTLGTWNVRGLRAIGKFELLNSKIEKTGVEILGVSEVK